VTRSYRLDAPAHAIAAALGADAGGDVWQGGDVAFGTYAPVVIRVPDRGRMMVPRLWGVPPPPGREHPLASLRNLESPFWIGTLRHTQFRCLIPVTAYRGATASPDAKGWYSVPSAPIFALAGIWRDSEIPSFAIVSTEPNALAEANRAKVMPLILHPQDYGLWLTGDWKQAQRLVSSFPSQLMRME
jgi:putative SOS response-associated peptidase YedK